MNKNNVSTAFLTLIFLYQISFIYIYLTDRLANINLKIADTYWITAGLFGVIIGGWMMTKIKMGPLLNLLSFIVLIIGIGLIGLLLLATGITSM